MIREAMEGGRKGRIHWETVQRRGGWLLLHATAKIGAGHTPLHCENGDYYTGVSTVRKQGKKFSWRRLSSFFVIVCLIF